MHTLDDLRRTLDQHAEDVADPAAVARTSAVHHRVAAVRRRRRATGAGALALALLAGLAAVLVPRVATDSLPAAPVVLGERAPTTMDSLGYTYRTDGTSASGSRRVGVVVKPSDQPQLYSWAADQATEVKVHVPGGEVWDSVYTHFGDFVVVPPGASGRLSVAAARGEVGIARYTLTDAPAPGYTRNGVTYRDSVAGRNLLAAAVAAPGSTQASTPLQLLGGRVVLAPLCTGVPSGYDVVVTVDGRRTIAGDCSDPNAFDPAGTGGYTQRLGPDGKTVTVRVLLTDGLHSTTPVTGDFAHLKLGVGVYDEVGSYGPDQRMAGIPVGNAVEHGGHLWTGGHARLSHGAPVRIPATAVDQVAAVSWRASGFVRTTFVVQGETPQLGEFANGPRPGVAAMGNLWVAAGHAVRVHLNRGKGPFVVSFYFRNDPDTSQ